MALVAAGTPLDLTSRRTAAAVSVGVVALLMSGLLPLFLSALAVEHRLSPAGIGRVATLELLSSALTTGLVGAVLPPHRLRLVGVVAALMLAAADAATLGASGAGLMLVRALAGVPEGVLLWIAVGLIARSAAPDRLAGVLFTAMASSQLVCAVVLTTLVLPRFGADGAYLLMAGLSALGALVTLGLPGAYGPLPSGVEAGAPPFKGWIALFAVFVFQASIAGVGVYLVPLALQAGLGPGAARIAVSAAFAFEVLGGSVATALSGRVNFLDVLLFSAMAMLGAFGVYLVGAPAWLFIAASASVGLCALLIMPFIVPMTIKADPSRRAAVQIGGAQLLGGASGPVLASLVVSARDAHGAVYLSAGLLVTSLGAIFALNRHNERR